MSSFVYGKISQYAVSAVSYLAEHHGGDAMLSSAQIAEGRSLPKPVVAKILTTLSAAGIIRGIPGPNGGYALARNPSDITLLDIVEQFENTDGAIPCPLGPDWCGNGPQCPVHDKIEALRMSADSLLRGSNFDGFVKGRA